jgi:hypothetical protein
MEFQIRRSVAPFMARRYELTTAQWERIRFLLPGKAGDPGRTAVDIYRLRNRIEPLLQQAQTLQAPRHPLRPKGNSLPCLHPPCRDNALDALNVDSA